MFKFNNMKKIFIALLIIAVAPTLCLASDIKDYGTRVNVGAYSGSLGLVVMLVNPNATPIKITKVKIFRPDGTLEISPDWLAGGLPGSSFTLGPFESKGFSFTAAGITPVVFPPPRVFQMHFVWESAVISNGLKGYSVVIAPGTKIAVEGFDIEEKKK